MIFRLKPEATAIPGRLKPAPTYAVCSWGPSASVRGGRLSAGPSLHQRDCLLGGDGGVKRRVGDVADHMRVVVIDDARRATTIGAGSVVTYTENVW